MSAKNDAFWRGEFGDAYNKRSPGNLDANIEFFKRVLVRTTSSEGGFDPQSVIELGCGVGTNLMALEIVDGPGFWRRAGVEINEQAALAAAVSCPTAEIFGGSFLDWTPPRTWNLAFTKGVLIHIAPEDLPRAYAKLHQASDRYILVAEYYNPKPLEVPYRGHSGRLWKRDFAGELLDRFKDLRLIDYGFVYHRDAFPQDDLTWFLMEKR